MYDNAQIGRSVSDFTGVGWQKAAFLRCEVTRLADMTASFTDLSAVARLIVKVLHGVKPEHIRPAVDQVRSRRQSKPPEAFERMKCFAAAHEPKSGP